MRQRQHTHSFSGAFYVGMAIASVVFLALITVGGVQ